MQFLITAIVAVILLVSVASSCPIACNCTDVSDIFDIDCSSRGLGNIPTNLPNNTDNLYLYKNKITSIKSDTFNNFRNLYRLYLFNNEISMIEDNNFNNLPNLAELSLQKNKITSIKSGTFNNLGNLYRLNLSDNNISVIEDNNFNNLPNLRHLLMGNNSISIVGENAFENLPQLTSLVFDMHCRDCDNIQFWLWLKGNHQFLANVTCNDFDGKKLSDLQYNQVCIECKAGYYDYNCNRSCDGCLLDSCDSEHGICSDTSGCKPGWQPRQPKCDLACVDGTYGQNCSQDCSNNCYNNTCHVVSGLCLFGCRKSWMGLYCKQPCSKGHFGNNCNDTCDGCISKLCNSSDGVCDSQGLCKAGWYGVKCDKECTTGRYGVNCESYCHTCVNMMCNTQDGHCTYGCIDGFKGDGCHSLAATKSDDNYTAVYTGVGASIGTALVAVIIVLVILRYRRQNKQQKRSTRREYVNTTFSDDHANSEVHNTEPKYVAYIPEVEEEHYETI